MAVKIRLTRLGKKKKPFYRVVAVDSRVSRDGRYLENLGYFSPASANTKPVLQEARVSYWLKLGAIPSPTVRKLISSVGVLQKLEDEKIEVKKSSSDAASEGKAKRKGRRKRYTTVAEMVKRRAAKKEADEGNAKKREISLTKKKIEEAKKAAEAKKEEEASKPAEGKEATAVEQKPVDEAPAEKKE